jgi:membrane protease YdiL (CAAX protease family)
LPLIVVANLGLTRAWASVLTFVCAAACLVGPLAALGLLDVAAAVVPRRGGPSAAEAIRFGAGFLATAAVAAILLVPDVRAWLARFLPIDAGSPVHALALALFAVLFGFNATYQLSTDVLSQTASSVSPLTPLDLLAQEAPLLLAGIAGVGWLLRRPSGAALGRLGLVAPRWWQLALALAVAGAFYAFSNGVELVSQALTPEVAHKVNAANQRLFGGLDNPAGILTLALAAGVCEEVLFRGALQPRFGIILTSLLFSSVHTQYGLSFDTLGVFMISCGLGLLRRFFNTTTSLACHVCYDVLAGVGIGLALLPWALAGEAALLALVAFAGLRRRRPALAIRP